MKKFMLFALTCCLALSFCANVSYAAEPYEDTSEDICSSLSPDLRNYDLYCTNKTEDDLIAVVGNVLNTAYFWIGIVAVVFIIIGGYKYSVSQGDPGKIKTAKDTILYAIIGLVAVLLAFAITAFTLSAVNGNAGGTGGGGGGGGNGGQSNSREITALEIRSAKEMKEGETLQIKVRIVPSFAENKKLTFTSSDPTVATISETGLITALRAGSTVITATAENGVSTSITLTVVSLVEVGSITLNPTSASVVIHKTVTISATVSPDDASDKSLEWTSSDNSIASVKNGIVTGNKIGSAIITATAKNGVKASATVTVEPDEVKYPALREYRNYKHSTGYDINYHVNVPEGATSKMPLVIYLHGDNMQTYVADSPQVKYMFGSTKFISLVPITWDETGWSGSGIQQTVKGLIDKYVADYRIDTKRIYIVGFSRGAIGTWDIIDQYPNFFAAAIPISCGAGRSLNYNNFKNTKIRGYVGGLEGTYASRMQDIVDNIVKIRGTAELIKIEGANHEYVTYRIPNDAAFNWLLQQHL